MELARIQQSHWNQAKPPEDPAPRFIYVCVWGGRVKEQLKGPQEVNRANCNLVQSG